MHVFRLTLAVLVSLACSSAVALAQHAVLSNGERRTLDCHGQDVKVTGSRNELTLRGSCPRVDVAGAANVIAIETVDRIDVTGTGNRVTWARGLTRPAPRVSTTGVNAVEQAEVTANSTTTTPTDLARSKAAPAQSSTPAAPHDSVGERSTSVSSSDDGVSVLTDNGTHTIECRGRRVLVAGSGNRLTLDGPCPEVQISGDRNTVDIDVAGRINVPGTGNTVSWFRASNGQEPRTSVTGNRNRITQRR
jgi:hypothetical protein